MSFFTRTSAFMISLFLITLMGAQVNAASQGGEHKNTKARDLFPKPEANKSKVTRLPKVTLIEPKALSTVQGNQVTLKWQAAEGADSYRVQVASDANFKWLIANEDFYKDTSYELKGLEAGKHYFWRVYAWKSDNDPSYLSGFADFSSFETK